MDEGVIVELFNAQNQKTGVAVVTDVIDDIVYARIIEDGSTNYKTAKIQSWWAPLYDTEEILSEAVFTQDSETCILDVQCLVPKSHEAGSLGWTLFCQLLETLEPLEFSESLIPVAQGNDRLSFGKISFQHAGLWKAGNYYLRAKRYSKRQLITLQEMNVSWTIKTDSLKLSYGNLSDPTPPLNLRG